jgi:hypothetical protein
LSVGAVVPLLALAVCDAVTIFARDAVLGATLLILTISCAEEVFVALFASGKCGRKVMARATETIVLRRFSCGIGACEIAEPDAFVSSAIHAKCMQFTQRAPGVFGI